MEAFDKYKALDRRPRKTAKYQRLKGKPKSGLYHSASPSVGVLLDALGKDDPPFSYLPPPSSDPEMIALDPFDDTYSFSRAETTAQIKNRLEQNFRMYYNNSTKYRDLPEEEFAKAVQEGVRRRLESMDKWSPLS